MDDNVNLEWHLAPGHETETVNALKNEGVHIRGGLGFEPLTMIAIALGVSTLIKALINLYRDARYKGVVIDATSEPVQIREMPGWSRRQVLVINAEGAHFLEAGADESAAGELSKIADLLKKH